MRDIFGSNQISLSGITEVAIRKFKMLYFQNQERYGPGIKLVKIYIFRSSSSLYK